MTKARTVLQLLVEGKYSAELIAEKTGLSLPDVREAIRTLRKGNRVKSVVVPIFYEATPEGERDLARAPMPPKVLSRKSRERRSREQQAQTIVGSAIQRQPALAQVWGAMA